MIDQALLPDLTEAYLKALISEVSGSVAPDFDSRAPFGELGIDSFYVLKIIRRLEADFGRLPKSLLFEHFNIQDLATYFVGAHEQTLTTRFAGRMNGAHARAVTNGRHHDPIATTLASPLPIARPVPAVARVAAPIRILETDALAHPELRDVVRTLFDRYKIEGSVSLGTRKIAPNLFIGSARRGYINYGRSQNIILAYGYTGPRDYVPALLEELFRYCEAHNFQLNVLADQELPAFGGTAFSATPFGVLQRIVHLQQFTLDGQSMRRLRYQVSKFEKAGVCRTEEYRCGSNPAIDQAIAGIIDRWCARKAMINPLVHDTRRAIVAGTLSPDHRLFLTYLDDVLQNVIVITAMCREVNGYLMDLEFYAPEMPMGGLEFAIVRIVDVLVAEGCEVLSLGGTYGCKLEASASADREVDAILDSLREQDMFNDQGNLQFKNKFRPENRTIFLCRPVGSPPDNVIDIIMMIADPDKMQTSDAEHHNAGDAPTAVAMPTAEASAPAPAPAPPPPPPASMSVASAEPVAMPRLEWARILSEHGFNPLNIPDEHIACDLKTDSWAQLRLPAIQAHMQHLHARLQQPGATDDSVRAVFPFAHILLTESGQAAERLFFKAWPTKGVVPQNLLFPSTIFHLIDNGFTPAELPHPAVFDLESPDSHKGEVAWAELEAQVTRDPGAIPFVCIELNDNAAGGYPVSTRHLRQVKDLLARHAIPLVLDGTRVMENAQCLIEQDTDYAGRSIWAVVRDLFSCADAVIGSLTKDFCVNKGGIVATNDAALFQRLQGLVQEDGGGLDLIDRRLIALSLQQRTQIEAKVLRRIDAVRLIWRALKAHGVPVVQPAGSHCILIDVKQVPEFKDFRYPAASFVAWLFLNTGIRASAHSVGMQKHTRLNDLVRLAIPVGLTRDQIDRVIEHLIRLFDQRVNIPELDVESGATQALGNVYANYRLTRYHRAPSRIIASEPPAIARAPGVDAGRAGDATERVHSDSGTAHAATGSEPTRDRVAPRPRRTQDIAIVGMAGRYPKAKNLRELWDNLARGRDCIEQMPADRYERRLQHGSTARYRAGFIDDIDKFDSLFFNISPREAEMLDPQERLFLEVAWEAVEDAGYYPEILARDDAPRNIGVFVGAVWAMYQMLGVEEKHAGNPIVPNSFLWSIANRVSYWMNLSGPSLTVDTACSSSLTALYLACEAIQAGDCSAAIVGGVNLDVHQAKLDINQTGGALSPDGVCRSFGKGANGYVMGEGVGALLLKPLDQAVKDRDNIYGVIKSAVLNHGGRTSGYTVPNPKAQATLIAAALDKAAIDARSIGYIEAHGTGTELGDPIEIAGLNTAFGAGPVASHTCAIGSIKSNIGHLEAAAGVVSITKVLLQMRHRQLAPSLHSAELNEFIEFEQSPFYVVQQLADWAAKDVDGQPVPLRAGISSFGAGGANAHIILEQYEPEARTQDDAAQPDDLIFPLSARTEDQLRETARRLAAVLDQDRLNLADVAFTLQHGRKSFDHRVAIIAATTEILLDKLTAFIAGRKSDDVVAGHVTSADGITRWLTRTDKEELIRLVSRGGDPRKMAGLWAEGLLSDWRGFQANGSGRRISLPTYPFADKRHWAFKSSPIRHGLQIAAGVHPLIDSNESTFERQLFKKVFHDRDFFIYDHQVADIPTLPGVAYLELARKAGEMAAGRPVRKIRNILWVSPISVQHSTPKEVFIELKPSDATVKFEVFSHDANGNKVLHSQGSLLYATRQDAIAEPEYVDLKSLRARCAKVIDGKDAYPLFTSFGLNLGPSFQVLQDVYKNDEEVLGVLKLPEFRHADLQSMVLQPSLIDGSLQAGMSAQLGDKAGEMFVPFSIGEVEILHPLQANCFSYVTQVKDERKVKSEHARTIKTNVLIVDETGKVLVKIRESTGVPLREVHKQATQAADADGFSRLCYAYDWENAPLTIEPSPQDDHESMVLFDTDDTLHRLYQDRLRRAGQRVDRVVLVRPGEHFQDAGGQSYTVNPRHGDDFVALLTSLADHECPVRNICFGWGTGEVDLRDEQSVQDTLERGVSSLLLLCQALIKHKVDGKVQLLALSSGTPDDVQPLDDAMSGFINTLHLEHPKLLCKTLDVRQDSVDREWILDAILAEVRAHTQDATVVRYGPDGRQVRKLKAFDLDAGARATPAADALAATLRDKGVYLITGGAGGLGRIFAEYLAKECKARLVLTGRSALSPDGLATLDELTKLGAEILYLPADVSRREDVTHLIDACKTRFGAINGVIHAAGVLRDSLIRNKTVEEMDAVFAPKIHGMRHLDELTQHEPLDFFVTFSSLAALAGNGGQCDYSYANHFMDSLAAGRERLRAKGMRFGKTLSLNWSLWANGGMKVDEQTEIYFKKTLGMKPLSTRAGLDAFVQGLGSDRSQFAVVEGVQEKLEIAWGLRPKRAALADAATPRSVDRTAAAPVSGEAAGELAAWIENELSQLVMEFLKLDPSDMSVDKILLDLGFDSIGLTTFANAINEKYALDITPVLFFEYPSVAEIARYLSIERESEMRQFRSPSATATASGTVAAPSASPRPTETGRSEPQAEASFAIRKGWNPAALDRQVMPRAGEMMSPQRRFAADPIAIVGMSGVMPQSADLDEFWEHLRNADDLITVIPPERWRWEDYDGDPFKEANKSNSKWGGFMKEVDKFDPQFFGISVREAQMMDPQQRIFLETVWKAIEDSGQKVSDLSGTRTGLFVGAATNDYVNVMNGVQTVLDAYSAPGNSHSVLANRVSFLLNLRGPSAPIDTACSSSLVALHRAIESIHTGSCDMAIVGGVQAILSPAAYISFGMAGVLSNDGKCRTFDKRASGYARGEGAGAIVLKRLSAAEADNNHIYAVIKATAENHGGRVAILTAPNASAQAALLIEAYDKAQIDPGTVGYIECHGTGTSLGDPIETQALTKAFAELYKRHDKRPADMPHCGLSCVKSNIGHLETAAGMASLFKVLLAIKHKQIPATIHFEEVNPYIKLGGTPFYIADKLTSWQAPLGEDGAPLPRRAGVSAFGFGGANAHIVLEEYIAPARPSPARVQGPHVIVLSAKNDARLKAYIQSMIAYLDTREVDIDDFAYTLQVGRDEMPARLAFVASRIDEVRQTFAAMLDGSEPAPDSYRNTIRERDAKSQETIGAAGEAGAGGLIERDYLSRLARLWVSGATIDWRSLYASGLPKRISVPTYPFAKERYWIPSEHVAVSEKPNSANAHRDIGAAAVAPVRADAMRPVQSLTDRSRLHPLLQSNTSTLGQQSYSTILTGAEPFLSAHSAHSAHPIAAGSHGSQPVLPAAVYLEMARAAMAAAASLPDGSSVIELEEAVWGQPVVIDGRTPLTIALLATDSAHMNFEVSSQAAAETIIHCQGRVFVSDRPAPAPVDVRALQGAAQLLAPVSVPTGATTDVDGRHDGYVLHPSVMTGALQAGFRSLTGASQSNGASVFPDALASLRVWAPCAGEMLAWARPARAAGADDESPTVDIDLIDPSGRVCVQMRGLSFQGDDAATESASQATWLFSRDLPPELVGAAVPVGVMTAAAKIELFLQQEIALQLQQPLDDISADRNFFDVGLTSLGIADLVQRTSRILDDDLSPSALFEYRDIHSVAAYLAATYPASINALSVVRLRESESPAPERSRRRAAMLTAFPRGTDRPVRSAALTPEPATPVPVCVAGAVIGAADISGAQVLEKIVWQEAALDETYERVTL
jgi:polyketide synthase PksN